MPITGDAWKARVFANLYPLSATHEVIVNAARHATSIRELSIPELEDMVSMWQMRSAANDTSKDDYVHLFVNDGLDAGASLPHTHAQLLKIPRLPGTDVLFSRCVSATDCSVCSLLNGNEFRGQSLDGYRFMESGGLVACVSPAPRRAGTVILAPANHQTDFPGFDNRLIATALHQLFYVIDEHPMNLWVVQNRSSRAHWYIEVVPRIGRSAGVELGLGLDVCIQDPREYVSRLIRRDLPATQ